MERFETQTKGIMNWLKEGHSITPIEALNMFGAFRLSAIIFNLRKVYGLDIVTEMVYEGKKRYAKYYIKKEENGE